MRLFLLLVLAAFTYGCKAGLADPVPATPYAEPVVLSSQGGVLEVTLSARQGEGKLDTVGGPVQNMLLFSYQVQKGTANNGQLAARNCYPAPTLHVDPGETLIVHLENNLTGLSIRDFFDPAFTPPDKTVPLEPPLLTEAPFNLHTHGLHVSPMGNSDNVLLNLPGGARNTYEFKLPKDHPQGMYWYHGHLHTLTTVQTYYGLAGMLIIGRADGNLPVVTQKQLPIRTMALQYNFVFNRRGGQRKLTNPSWTQWVSTKREPAPGEVESGKYRPYLAPPNLTEAPAGTRWITNWYTGPLSINNNRGKFELIPNNLLRFQGQDGTVVEPNPGQPDVERDVQFTVNGLFQPEIESRPGQTEIWVLANISDLAYMRVQLTETATGRHPQILVVGQDGLPYTQAQTAVENGGTVLNIPPASRYAIAVTLPQTGELQLGMPQAYDVKKTYAGPGVMYTSRGQGPPTGALGTISVDLSGVSYFDGFFYSPTQMLVRATVSGEPGTTAALAPGQALGALTPFFDTRGTPPAVTRKLVINGGFLDEKASQQDPKAFIYAFNSRAFPNTPLLRPRLGSVEEWSFVNYNNDEHPIHIHVNDFQVTKVVDPVSGYNAEFQPWDQDNANVPVPLMGPEEAVIEPGELALRTLFVDFLGTYVMHCHRLNHEDNGLMTMVNVIPAVSSYAVARDGQVQVRDGNGDRVLATVTPFPEWKGPLTVAMGDVNQDAVLDLIVGTGAGTPARVVSYSGKDFVTELARFAPFDPGFSGGVTVAAGNLDGSPGAENIVVGSGAGMQSRVRVFSSRLPALGTAPAVFGEFSPYQGQNGVVVSVGMVEAESGRNSILTAPGPGQPCVVRAYRYEVEKPEFCGGPGPVKIADFPAFDAGYTGGVTLATDWMSAGEGGAQMIVVGQRAAPGEVRIFSSGSALDGYPRMYNKSPNHHSMPVGFRAVVKLRPFEAVSALSVATTSTTNGADLLVSGALPGGRSEVRKYRFERAPKASVLGAQRVGQAQSQPGAPATLGGD